MKHLRILSAVALLLATVPAGASTFVAMTPVEMVTQADAVVQGHVIDIESRWSDSGRLILTEVQIQVEETLIGEAPSIVTVRTFGGQVGDVRVEAIGFPTFEEKERVLLFLAHEEADDSLRVLGYRQGQFRVVTRRDGKTLAVPMMDEESRYITKSGALLPVPDSVEIHTFKSRLIALAAKAGRVAER